MTTPLTSGIASQAANASLPAFNCPPGTKMYLLNLGTLECDEGWYVCIFMHLDFTRISELVTVYMNNIWHFRWQASSRWEYVYSFHQGAGKEAPRTCNLVCFNRAPTSRLDTLWNGLRREHWCSKFFLLHYLLLFFFLKKAVLACLC